MRRSLCLHRWRHWRYAIGPLPAPAPLRYISFSCPATIINSFHSRTHSYCVYFDYLLFFYNICAFILALQWIFACLFDCFALARTHRHTRTTRTRRAAMQTVLFNQLLSFYCVLLYILPMPNRTYTLHHIFITYF